MLAASAAEGAAMATWADRRAGVRRVASRYWRAAKKSRNWWIACCAGALAFAIHGQWVLVLFLVILPVMVTHLGLYKGRQSRTQRLRVVGTYSIILPLVLFGLVAVDTSGLRGDLRFYELSAQILPILVLALIVEARLFGRGDGQVAAYAAMSLVMLAGLGEASALTAVFKQEAEAWTTAVVAGSMTAVGFALLLRAILLSQRPDAEASDAGRRKKPESGGCKNRSARASRVISTRRGGSRESRRSCQERRTCA
jgi:hypothetical protein